MALDGEVCTGAGIHSVLDREHSICLRITHHDAQTEAEETV